MAVYFAFEYFLMLVVIQGAAVNWGMIYIKENSSCWFMLMKSVLAAVLFLLLSEVLLTTCHMETERGQ